MAPANKEAYMLQRNSTESTRLNTQHAFFLALAHAQLIHPSIPRQKLRAIADVGTGTGVWLRETAQELVNDPQRSHDSSAGGVVGGGAVHDHEFVGFDISPSQFPHPEDEAVSSNIQVDFVVHDITEPFPSQYHGKFDLVHIRLLSYAIKAADLVRVVENVVQILRPGGYLQWQESDATDSWATPSTPLTRDTIAYVVSERVARGLTPASVFTHFNPNKSPRIVTPLLKTIQSLNTHAPPNHAYQPRPPVNWTADIMRVISLETLLTTAHPSPTVSSGKGPVIKAAAVQLLQAGVTRRREKVAEATTTTTEVERQGLVDEIEEMERLGEEIKAEGGETARGEWDMAMTWIVAKKAEAIGSDDEHEPWMSARHTIRE